MTKKMKFIFTSLSLISVIAIVPVTVISCSSDSTNQSTPTSSSSNNTPSSSSNNTPSSSSNTPSTTATNKATIDSNVKALQSFKNISAKPNVGITATSAATLINNNPDNLSILNNYFNASQIENAAKASGVKVSYSASVESNPISTIVTNFDTLSNNTTATLVITITLTLGSISQTQIIYVNGFPVTEQTALNNFINSINVLPTNTITGNSSIPVSNLTNLNVSQYLNNVPSIPDGITITFSLSNSNPTTGTIDITINASAANATLLSSNPIQVSGWSDNMMPPMPPISTNNPADEISKLIINAIPDKQSISVFNGKENITFTLNAIPSWLTISSSKLNSILTSNNITLSEVSITLTLPTGVANSDGEVQSFITVTIKSGSNTSASNSTMNKFA